MKIYPYLSYRREINETDVNYTCNWQKVWYSSDSLNGNGCSLLIFIRSTIPFISGDFFRAYGKAGIRNRKRNRKRKRKRNWNPNPNLRNKNWGRFCLKSVTNNNCSIKTFHPHIIFIYCYYIFYCRIFCVRRKIFLREFHIRVSVAPPFAAFPSQWMKRGALLTKGSSKNIQCYQKMLPFYKNISVFVYRSRQSDESIEM